MNKKEIFTVIKNHKDKIKEFGIIKIGLFGSCARDEQNAQSDIDLLAIFHKGKKTYKNFIHLCFYLDSLFGQKVDLLTPEGISPYIKPYIDKEVIYEELS